MEFLLGLGKIFWTLFQVIVLFNILIVVHELGHYWAAKWRGLKVEKFQIWFGKPIWKKKIKGVQWGFGWIPMGGFVALPQMAPMEMLEGKNEGKEPLPPIKPLDKKEIFDSSENTGGLITIEENNILGGFGSAVSEVCMIEGKIPRKFQMMGLNDEFSSIVGSQKYLRKHYKLDAASIVKKVKSLLN